MCIYVETSYAKPSASEIIKTQLMDKIKEIDLSKPVSFVTTFS